MGIAALMLVAGHAAAQPVQLNQSTIRSQTISSQQTSEIEAYAQGFLTDLESDAPDRNRRGLDGLVSPLTVSGSSVRFRLAYAQALQPTLERMIDNAELTVRQRIMAMRLAGELATDRSVRLIEPMLDSDETHLAMFAAFAAEIAFAASDTTNPTMNAAAAEGLVRELAQLIPEENDSLLVGARVRALAQAMELTDEPLARVGTMATAELARRAAEHLRLLDPEDAGANELRPVLDAAIRLRTVITGRGRDVDAEPLVEAVGLAADMVHFMAQRMDAKAADQSENSFDTQFANVAETLGAFADRAHSEATRSPVVWPDAADLGTLVANGDNRGFQFAASRIVTDAPGSAADLFSVYRFKVERFER